MRIGIEVRALFSSCQAGHYYYCAHLVRALGRLRMQHAITLFADARHTDGKLGEVVQQCKPLSLKLFRPPSWLYRVRVALSELNRQDALFTITGHIAPPCPSVANIYLIPDLSPSRFPQYHTAGLRAGWDQLLETVKRHADLVITFSEHTRSDVIEHLQISGERVRAVPLAAADNFRPIDDRDRISAALQPLKLQAGRYILSVGTLEPRKNHVVLLQAFRRLIDCGEIDGEKLVLAGPLGWQYDGILDEIRRLRLENDVVHVGHVSPLETLVNGAAVMVYPSLFEGFGLPPLEAMACGTPVVTSNTSSIPEVVGEAGLMVDPHDEEALARAISDVLRDASLQQRMREAGVRRAAEFSWQRTAKMTIAAIEEGYRQKHGTRALCG